MHMGVCLHGSQSSAAHTHTLQPGPKRAPGSSGAHQQLHAQTYHSVLHIYGVHTSKEAVLAAPALLAGYAPEADFKRADLYLQHSITLVQEASPASATDVVADNRSLLVSFSNGTCQVYSWAGKVCVNGNRAVFDIDLAGSHVA